MEGGRNDASELLLTILDEESRSDQPMEVLFQFIAHEKPEIN